MYVREHFTTIKGYETEVAEARKKEREGEEEWDSKHSDNSCINSKYITIPHFSPLHSTATSHSTLPHRI
jgi:hypothetical protein